MMKFSRRFSSFFSLSVSAAFLAVLSGCGSDSTGPLGTDEALRSLAIGMQTGALGVPGGTPFSASLSDLGPFVNQASVTVDGKAETMFALGVRESFPSGTCAEALYVTPGLPASGTCTPPPVSLVLVLWQSHSAREAPDRLLIIAGDVGTSNFNFDFLTTPSAFPAFALYMEGEDKIWSSISGSLTSQVSASGPGCNLPLPPYAKTATCSVATFDEQGSIVFEPFDFIGSSASTQRLNVTIPRQNLTGIWQSITSIQPITLHI
jgi:hypothetical protein